MVTETYPLRDGSVASRRLVRHRRSRRMIGPMRTSERRRHHEDAQRTTGRPDSKVVVASSCSSPRALALAARRHRSPRGARGRILVAAGVARAQRHRRRHRRRVHPAAVTHPTPGGHRHSAHAGPDRTGRRRLPDVRPRRRRARAQRSPSTSSRSFFGEDAHQAAIEDGVDWKDVQYNPVYIRNENPLLRTLPVARDVHIKLIGMCEAPSRSIGLTQLQQRDDPVHRAPSTTRSRWSDGSVEGIQQKIARRGVLSDGGMTTVRPERVDRHEVAMGGEGEPGARPRLLHRPPRPTGPRPPPQRTGTLVIHGTGDVSLDPSQIPAFRTHGYGWAWSGLDGLFRRDDLTVVNLECPATDVVDPVRQGVHHPLRPGRPAVRPAAPASTSRAKRTTTPTTTDRPASSTRSSTIRGRRARRRWARGATQPKRCGGELPGRRVDGGRRSGSTRCVDPLDEVARPGQARDRGRTRLRADAPCRSARPRRPRTSSS